MNTRRKVEGAFHAALNRQVRAVTSIKNIEPHETCRPPGRAAHHVRAGREYENRHSARRQDSAVDHGARHQSDRLNDRRKLLVALGAGNLIAICCIGIASAQAPAYPVKPIRIVVPFPPGGFSDTLGRVIGQQLSEALGQPVINDNRPGASGTIGEDLVAKSAPDGYTLLTASLNYVIKPNMEKLPFDTLKDFAAVSLIAQGPPLVIAVSAASPYRALGDLIADARANPGKLTFASAGRGSSGHLTAELLRSQAGIQLVQVPYKGSVLGVTATISGEVVANASYLPVALPLVKSGRLRAVGLTGAKRSMLLPEVPTAAESGYPGCEVGGMMGLVAPAATPRSIVAKLNAALTAVAARADFVERLESYGMQPAVLPPEAFQRFIAAQIARWGTVLKRDAGDASR